MTILEKVSTYSKNPEVILLDNHVYWNVLEDRPIYAVSVTRMVRNRLFGGVDPYANAPADVMERAIERGNCVHAHLDAYVKKKFKYPCEQPEHYEMTEWCIALLSEIRAQYEVLGMFSELSFATKDSCGTVDLLLVVKVGKKVQLWILDWKTSTALHLKEYGYQLTDYKKVIKQVLGIGAVKLLIANPRIKQVYETDWNEDKKKFVKKAWKMEEMRNVRTDENNA